MLRHSSRNLPSKRSPRAFCQGFPGSISAVSMLELGQPTQQRRGDGLGPVVGTQVLRCAVNADQASPNLNHPAGADTARDVDLEAFSRKLIHHRQALQLLAVRAGIKDKVVGPDMIDLQRDQGPWPAG